MSAGFAVPLLPCPDLDEALEFYEHLGFQCTYRQIRPNPYGSVERSGIGIGLFGIDGFDPAESYASAILVVEDLDGWYRDFAAGFRHRYGKLRATGIPRILRPRQAAGRAAGLHRRGHRRELATALPARRKRTGNSGHGARPGDGERRTAR